MGLWDSALYLTSAALWATDELGYFRNLSVVQGDHFQHMLPRGFSRELTCIDGWARALSISMNVPAAELTRFVTLCQALGHPWIQAILIQGLDEMGTFQSTRHLGCVGPHSSSWTISAVSILPGKVVTLHRLLIWSVWELAGTCILLLEGGLLRS